MIEVNISTFIWYMVYGSLGKESLPATNVRTLLQAQNCGESSKCIKIYIYIAVLNTFKELHALVLCFNTFL